MKVPETKEEVHEFLRALKAELTARGSKELGALLDAALSCSPFMSTEFLGETRMGLWKLLREGKGRLSPQERAVVEQVIQKIDDGGERSR